MGAFYDLSADVIRWIYDRRIVAPTVLDIDHYFPDAWKFVRAWREIRDEALRATERLATIPRFHEIMREQTAISENDGRDWRMLILKAYGIENPINIAKCPMLASIVAATNFGTLFFVFTFVPFGTAAGMQFWFLEGALHGALASRPRSQ